MSPPGRVNGSFSRKCPAVTSKLRLWPAMRRRVRCRGEDARVARGCGPRDPPTALHAGQHTRSDHRHSERSGLARDRPAQSLPAAGAGGTADAAALRRPAAGAWRPHARACSSEPASRISPPAVLLVIARRLRWSSLRIVALVNASVDARRDRADPVCRGGVASGLGHPAGAAGVGADGARRPSRRLPDRRGGRARGARAAGLRRTHGCGAR